MKKIIISIIVSIGLLVGAIFFINSETSQKDSTTIKNYIVVKATGESNYPFEMTFPKGTKARDIALVFNSHYSHLYRKTKDGLLEVEDGQRIYSDIQMKIV